MKRLLALILCWFLVVATGAKADWYIYIFDAVLSCPDNVEIESANHVCVIDGIEYGPTGYPLTVAQLTAQDDVYCYYAPLIDVEAGPYKVSWATNEQAGICVTPHVSPGQDVHIRLANNSGIFADGFETGDLSAWQIVDP